MADDRTARVARVSPNGDGVIETAAGITYLSGALPGDMVDVSDPSAPVLVAPISPDRRAAPLCSHFGRCGGCALQHMSDDFYLRWKPKLLETALRQHGVTFDPAPMIRIPLASRRRAVFTAIRSRAGARLGFRRRRSHELEAISDCAVLAPAIVAALPGLGEIATLLLPMQSESRISVLSTPEGLDVAFEAKRRSLAAREAEALLTLVSTLKIARLTAAGDPIALPAAPTVSIADVRVTPPPSAFLQPSAAAEKHLQDLVVAGVGRAKRIADLFCGLGTFAFPLARTAPVLAIDSDRSLLDALEEARRRTNGLKPIETRVRDLFLDPLSPRELAEFDAVVFDPPRAGAGAQAQSLARSRVTTAVAVSCNPATLARDIKTLQHGGFRLEAVTAVDQFQFTPHLEAVAVLTR
jgi:23S rRNA (uracil1939-C5)-methyltransferase